MKQANIETSRKSITMWLREYSHACYCSIVFCAGKIQDYVNSNFGKAEIDLLEDELRGMGTDQCSRSVCNSPEGGTRTVGVVKGKVK